MKQSNAFNYKLDILNNEGTVINCEYHMSTEAATSQKANYESKGYKVKLSQLVDHVEIKEPKQERANQYAKIK